MSRKQVLMGELRQWLKEKELWVPEEDGDPSFIYRELARIKAELASLVEDEEASPRQARPNPVGVYTVTAGATGKYDEPSSREVIPAEYEVTLGEDGSIRARKLRNLTGYGSVGLPREVAFASGEEAMAEAVREEGLSTPDRGAFSGGFYERHGRLPTGDWANYAYHDELAKFYEKLAYLADRFVPSLGILRPNPKKPKVKKTRNHIVQGLIARQGAGAGVHEKTGSAKNRADRRREKQKIKKGEALENPRAKAAPAIGQAEAALQKFYPAQPVEWLRKEQDSQIFRVGQQGLIRVSRSYGDNLVFTRVTSSPGRARSNGDDWDDFEGVPLFAPRAASTTSGPDVRNTVGSPGSRASASKVDKAPAGKKEKIPDLYDPREEQIRAQRQGIYEAQVRKALGLAYNEPWRDRAGRRLDTALLKKSGIEKVRQLVGRSMFAMGTRVAQRYGRIMPGTQIFTPKTCSESHARYEGPPVELLTNRQDYEESLGIARKSGFYRYVPEVTKSGVRYFVWPLPPGQSAPLGHRSAAEAAAQVSSLNGSVDPLRTGVWWSPPSSVPARALAEWLPPDYAFDPARSLP